MVDFLIKFSTEIIISIVSLLIGGGMGYKIGVRKSIKITQKQKAADNAKQVQIGGKFNDASNTKGRKK